MSDRVNGGPGLATSAPRVPSGRSAPPAERLPRLRRRRRPLTAAAGAVLVAVCAAAVLALYTGATRQTAVLALARPVAPGQAITTADLRVAHVSGGGISAIPAADAGRVVGRSVTGRLPAGTLLSAGMLTASGGSGGGDVLGLALKPGSLPAGELAAGDRVAVFDTPASTTGSAGTAGLLVPSARVVSVQPDATSGTVEVDLAVDPAQALPVAAAAATGSVSLALLQPGGGR